MTSIHSFHIPVMGIGYTIDTPLKVSQYGIDSVISLADDILLEKMRKNWSEKFGLHYRPITKNMEDFRARRITSYLDLVNTLAREKFDALCKGIPGKGEAYRKYLDLLPEGGSLWDTSEPASEYGQATGNKEAPSMGSIDVNIMTKVDKANYSGGKALPAEYNDAHAAARGFAKSDLNSSLVLSAGMNPALYGYLSHFRDFFPDRHGALKKRIVLKVSDHRSALIQGKFLAKKGLWVSEFRIESGLNCGGHAFATEGHLMGPVLAKFRDEREALQQEMYELFAKALAEKKWPVPEKPLPMSVTVQGGVGTHEEHRFLIDHYKVDSVGWGTPFLLVPEATSVDEATRDRLVKAREKDLYLSRISPLGVPFHNLKGNSKDQEKQRRIDQGRPGSPCNKKYLALNTEFTRKSICPASRKYQALKIKALDKEDLSPEQYRIRYDAIVEKACLCLGLGNSAMKAHGVPGRMEGQAVSICPGPNLAYFSRVMSLKEMTDHIYGKTKPVTRKDRPNLFIKELNLYLEDLRKKLDDAEKGISEKQEKTLKRYAGNLKEGIDHYYQLLAEDPGAFENVRVKFFEDLAAKKRELGRLQEELEGQAFLR